MILAALVNSSPVLSLVALVNSSPVLILAALVCRMIAALVFKDCAWDFRLEWVKSINMSGHKYGAWLVLLPSTFEK